MSTTPSPTTQWGAPYVTLHGSEWSGGYGAMGVRIQIAGSDRTKLPDLDASPLWGAAHDAVEKVYAEVMAAIIAADPEAQKRRVAERAELVGLFPMPEHCFIEEITNGYSGNAWYSRHLPWFVITTPVGRFTVGWRKRVISIDWTQTRGTKTAAELFPDEDVTKGERDIHAWSVEKARYYVAAVINSATHA